MNSFKARTLDFKENKTVGDIVQGRKCPRFYPQEKVTGIIGAMHGHHSGAAGVIDASGRFIGLITEREILRRLFGMIPETTEQERFAEQAKPIGELTAWDVMIASPDCLQTDVTIDAALDIITDKGFRYMPVVDLNKRLVGIVGERELYTYGQARARRELEAKDTLLSYFMHHEPYGSGGAAIS